jgi:acetylornithine deacetylase/succinyl-diaminopimelate desuccinylase
METAVHDLLIDLVEAPSYPGLPRQEAEVVRRLAAFLDAHGIAYDVSDVADGRPNLVAHVAAPVPGPHLVLCGHTDTVPPNVGAEEGGLGVRREGDVLYGRGAVDMKGAIAAMAGALVALRPLLRRGRVSLAAVVDEEMQSLGAEALIRSGFRADAAIVGEPTRNEIAIGHKGLEWLNVDFEGRAAHGGAPGAGINAVWAAARFIQIVERELAPALARRADSQLGPPTINIGTIHGGDQPSTIARHCRVQLDRRWVMAETVDQVFGELESILGRVRDAYPGLQVSLSRMPQGMATMVHGPMVTPPDHAVVMAARHALRDCGMQPVITVFPAWTDASLLAREAGIPAIVWGPGDLACAHTPDEHISLADVSLATRLYTLSALSFTSAS